MAVCCILKCGLLIVFLCCLQVSDINTFTSNKTKSRLIGLLLELYCTIVVILGNAYLTSFFNCGQSSTVLRQCLSSYQQAVWFASSQTCLTFVCETWQQHCSSALCFYDIPINSTSVGIYRSTRCPVVAVVVSRWEDPVQAMLAGSQVASATHVGIYLLTSVANIPGRSILHASSCGHLIVPRTRRRIGDRAFSVAAPRAWNRLQTELKLLRSTDSFRRDLKTFLFHSVYEHQDTDWLCDAPSVF